MNNALTARSAAFDLLLRVEGGAYASELLARLTLDKREAGLASQIVFGVLRYRGQLDYLVEHYAGRGKLDAEIRIILRMGIYQLRYLERIPGHAAVSESVELVKRARKRSAAGLVNAVLRKVNRDPVAWPDRATLLSHPAWLLERWDAQYGVETANRVAEANLQQPETYIRAAACPPKFVATAVPNCFRMLSGDAAGFRIQDIGSQCVAPLLQLEPGQTFLDLCAAPGNKTAQALESGVQAIACDLHSHRLVGLRDLGIPLVVVNGTAPLPFKRQFDRILLDAPCSGTGTLARNPEIKWRLTPADLTDLQGRQRALLRHAWDALKPGGRMVFSTCSLEREENEDVVAGYPVERTLRRLPGTDPGDGFFAVAMVKSQ